MIGISEEVSASADSLVPSQRGSERQAAHYYRAMHARALEREQQWKQKARGGEKIIAALVYLAGLLLREIGELKRKRHARHLLTKWDLGSRRSQS